MLRLLFALLLSFGLFTGTHATTLKIATIAPDGTSWMKIMRKAGDDIAQRTGRRVELRFYPGGVMGNDRSVMRKIRIGQLHGGVFTANGLAERYRDIQLYGLPMVFGSQEEADYVRERMDPLLKAGLEDAGQRAGVEVLAGDLGRDRIVVQGRLEDPVEGGEHNQDEQSPGDGNDDQQAEHCSARGAADGDERYRGQDRQEPQDAEAEAGCHVLAPSAFEQ